MKKNTIVINDPSYKMIYSEEGDSRAYLNIAASKDDDSLKFVASIAEDPLTNQFNAMTFGTLLYSIPLADVVMLLKVHLANNRKIMQDGEQDESGED